MPRSRQEVGQPQRQQNLRIMAKSHLKFNRVSGSGVRKIERYVRNGYKSTRRAIRLASIPGGKAHVS